MTHGDSFKPGRRGARIWQVLGTRSLKRQLVARFVLVFMLVTVVGSLLVVLAYQALSRQTERRVGDNSLQNLKQRFERQQDVWLRDAEEVKSQIDFMRIFVAPDQAGNLMRLQAYFASMEGKLDRFSSGALLDPRGRVVLRYGPEGGELERRLRADPALPRWMHSAERRRVYAVLARPLWLGVEGRGLLVMLQPVDDGLLRQLTAAGAELYLVLEGQVLASSEGARGYNRLIDAEHSGHLDKDAGFFLEQRVLPLFGAGPRDPRLVLQQRPEPVLSTPVVLLASFLLMAALAGVLWLVLGRWVSRLAQRVARLSDAASGFARQHALGPAVEHELREAQAEADDEISAVAEASRALMKSVEQYDEERFAYLQTLDMLEEGVVELAADGRYLRCSPGWSQLAGIEVLPGERIFDHVHLDDIDNLEHQFQQLVQADKTGLSGRLRLRRPDAKELWVEYRFISSTGLGGQVRGVLRDITQSYQLEKHVTHMALHDALTGLPNRVLLEDRCKMALRSAERSGMTVALGFLDLDHFKHVNDQFGHKMGDELLTTLSGALGKCLRSGDTLARWGGDEFVVLLTDLGGHADAEDAIAKLAQVCQTPIRIGETVFSATFSMGVALYPADATDVENLLSQSDRAMFAAKQQGRNTVRFFAEIAQREEDRKALYIQNRLAIAIREGRIKAWFQPIVDARTHRVVSCEALARWQDETYGWVSPATFVPMAENLGLIRELGQQIWKQSIESLHRWRQRGLDMRISVNVSRRQLFTPTFTADLLEDLERLAIPVSVVDLEITESVAMEDAEHTERRLAELSEAGFGIAIDDFGTGFSSLSQLHDMPATKIKIDISFVRRAQTEQGSQLIQAVVKIASAFGLQTVAEGVESAEIAKVLTGQGVTLLQGYHFGKPMSTEDFERHIDAPISAPP
ncbi:MAG: putative bifunctional diguanylate cyclase/phosphodiesterase [Curvibacter sp.]|jgi:diguanylate cyclase (GGDEF)-like protein